MEIPIAPPRSKSYFSAKKRRRLLLRDSDEMDPLGFLVNLFDVALALMIALVSNLKLADLLTSRDFTIVTPLGEADMEIITREGGKVSRYVAGKSEVASRQGRRVGTAYQLDSGEIIYVPDAADNTDLMPIARAGCP